MRKQLLLGTAIGLLSCAAHAEVKTMEFRFDHERKTCALTETGTPEPLTLKGEYRGKYDCIVSIDRWDYLERFEFCAVSTVYVPPNDRLECSIENPMVSKYDFRFRSERGECKFMCKLAPRR